MWEILCGKLLIVKNVIFNEKLLLMKKYWNDSNEENIWKK